MIFIKILKLCVSCCLSSQFPPTPLQSPLQLTPDHDERETFLNSIIERESRLSIKTIQVN